MLVNGTVYPVLTLKPGRHRLRILNACNARFLNLNLFIADPANKDGITINRKTNFPINAPGPAMTMIAAECGWLTRPVNFQSPVPCNPMTFTGNLLLAPAERADILIDIPAADSGKAYILYNDAPAPFPGGSPLNDYYVGAPNNPIQTQPGTGPDTRQLLRIVVDGQSGANPLEAGSLNLGALRPDPALPVNVPTAPVLPVSPLPIPGTIDGGSVTVRDVSLNEGFDQYGRLMQMLGTLTPQATGGFGQAYMNPATENAKNGSWEVWHIYNLTEDTHPIHIHLVNMQVLQRQPIVAAKATGIPALSGAARGPELEELCWKETVKCHPLECTTVLMKFELPDVSSYFSVPVSTRTGGHEYVWHCHILEHEEHDMMRPLVVTQ